VRSFPADVSRETVKESTQSLAPEQIAAQVRTLVEKSLETLAFIPAQPEFAERIERLAAALALWGARMNLTAAPDDPTEIAFHIVDSLMPLVLAVRPEGAVLKDAFAAGRRVLDLGSGAGFPGLVLAAAARAEFTLLEARRKRASFLSVTAAQMELRNVTINPGRGEPSGLTPVFDVVTARAFAQAEVFQRTAAAALRPGGRAILYANPGQELALARAGEHGLGDYTRIEYVVPHRGAEPTARILAVWIAL
jgi:16S rRNA (guanine527-N7)-methyltransferase